MLLRCFRLTVSIGIGQPKPFNILLIALILAVFVPLLSITILRGSPLTTSAREMKFVAAAWFRRLDNLKPSVFRKLRAPKRLSLFAPVEFEHALSELHST